MPTRLAHSKVGPGSARLLCIAWLHPPWVLGAMGQLAIGELQLTLAVTAGLLVGAAKEALDAVRKALVDLRNDEEFRRDSIAMMKFTPDYDTSAGTEKIFIEKSRPNPAYVAFFEKYIEDGKTASMKN